MSRRAPLIGRIAAVICRVVLGSTARVRVEGFANLPHDATIAGQEGDRQAGGLEHGAHLGTREGTTVGWQTHISQDEQTTAAQARTTIATRCP